MTAGAPDASGVGAAQRLQRLLRQGDVDAATAEVRTLLGELLADAVTAVRFTLDAYSLNSVSGTFDTVSGRSLFFKFHTEEGEEGEVGEYYRAELLAAAGIPVDVPVAHSTTPGSQIVVYAVRHEQRMADVCVALEREAGAAAVLPAGLERAQRELDRRIGEVAVATLDDPTPGSAAISLHQLFHNRLVSGEAFPGARYLNWYVSSPEYDALADLPWRIDGVDYDGPLRALVEGMERRLRPSVLAALPVVTAHGDDHQGNIWVVGDLAAPELKLFDPAFASGQVPALLAPVKATYHNVFAHPFWLYYPELVDGVSSEYGERVVVSTPGSRLSPLRQALLDSLTDEVWVPLLRELRRRDLLPEDWRATVRAALAACPLLVTNLLAESRTENVRMLGLARVVQAASEPVNGDDPVSRWLDRLEEALA